MSRGERQGGRGEHAVSGIIHGQEADPSMVGDPRFHGCERKRRFETKAEARKAAERASRRKDAPKIYVYRCEICGGWHLTHRKPRK